MRTYKQAVFSWSREQLLQPERTFHNLETYHIDTIFQHITKADTDEEIKRFLAVASDTSKEVYFLAGDPQWALDASAVEVRKVLERARSLSSHASLKGVVLDIEPYVLDEFKRDPKNVMRSFVKGMRTAYKTAQQHDIVCVVCVPYFFEQLGFTKELEEVITEASDAAAVMNYYRGKEIDHIQTEIDYSKRVRKPIFTIYELQPPGSHGLGEEHTYYHAGLKAAHRQFEQMQQAYPDADLHVAFHEYRYYIELAAKVEFSE